MVTMRPNGLRAGSIPQPPPDPSGRAAFPSGPEAPAAARRFVGTLLARTPPVLTADCLDEVRLIVSELVTNAIRYGTEPGDPVLVIVTTAAETVRVEVQDRLHLRPCVKPFAEQRDHGRGLFIVRALAVRWGVVDRPLGKGVWAEVPR